MGKVTSKPPDKEKGLSEGVAIIIAVLAITAAILGAIFAIKWLLTFFMPGLMG